MRFKQNHKSSRLLFGSAGCRLAVLVMLIAGSASGSALAANDVGAKPLPVAFEQMQPVFQTWPVLPKSRPDPALMFAAESIEIMLPVSKPDIDDVLPKSTLTVAEMIDQQNEQITIKEITLTLRSGEGIGSILRRGGYNRNKIANAVAAVSSKVNLRRLQVGTNFQIADQGFRFSVKPGRDIYVLNDPESGWLALNSIRPVDSYIHFATGVIEGSIYQATIAEGVSESALNEYVRVMGYSVDFQREIHSGDRFEMLYEIKRDRLTGESVGSKLLYAGLNLSGEQLGYFRFDNGNDTSWFDENGNSAARTLIRTPISGARLSSSFGHRKHPVSGFNAMHKGVDFAAPRGTPIISAGDGVVTEAGWKGSFGRYIRIRHSGTFDTAYAHMSRIATNIRRGSRVKQGETIGYVGSTGRVTGAHLHYEVMVNNRQVNPMTVQLPTGKKINAKLLSAFEETISRVDNELLLRGTNRFADVLTQPSRLAIQ